MGIPHQDGWLILLPTVCAEQPITGPMAGLDLIFTSTSIHDAKSTIGVLMTRSSGPFDPDDRNVVASPRMATGFREPCEKYCSESVGMQPFSNRSELNETAYPGPSQILITACCPLFEKTPEILGTRVISTVVFGLHHRPAKGNQPIVAQLIHP